jgi:leucyl/phenylalanyl-tRNA--protein transferase
MSLRLPWLGPDPEAPFPSPATALRHPNGLLAAGGDLGVQRLLAAYRGGIFPWYGPGEPILWWSPDPRCVFHTDRMHVPRRLARQLAASAWHVVADRAFAQIIDACAAPRDAHGGTWIVPEMREAYLRLHRAGHAHSIEVHDGDTLVGGLYGVAIGRMFFAESMFSARSNGSKAALLGLAHRLREWAWPLMDAQVPSPHLFTLGAQEMPRTAFLAAVRQRVAEPCPPGLWADAFGQLAVASLADPERARRR